MRYRGSEAYDLDMGRAQTRPQPERARSLTVLEGGRLDADARRGVSPLFRQRARIAAIVIAIFCVLGAVRVALSVGTVTLLQTNRALASQIEETQDLNDDLEAERSLLSSGSRITRIATEVYGMVYNPATSTLDVDDGSVDAAQDAD